MATTPPVEKLFAQSHERLREGLCAIVGRLLAGADETFTELAGKTTDEALQRGLLDARDFVVKNRPQMQTRFSTRWESECRKRAKKADETQSLSSFSLDDLQLVGDEDLDETLRFKDLAARLGGHCDEELSALDQRVRVLLGDAALESDDNPFGPRVICEAFRRGCKDAECPVEIRLTLLRLFDDDALDDIRSLYQDVNVLLIENGVLPKIRYGIARSDSRKRSGGREDEPKAKETSKAPSGEDLFAALSSMLGPGAAAAAAGGMGVGGVPQVQGAELLSSLTSLQLGDLSRLGEAAAQLGPLLAEAGNLKNVLHELKATPIGASMGRMDATTLDIVARLFDELFDDAKVPIALKGLIGRMQLPYLKVAIADKELFSAPEHPARRLLDTLGQIGMRLPAEFDASHPLFARIEHIVGDIVQRYEDGLAIFDEARTALESIIAEDDQRVAAEMESSEAQLRNAEKLAVAKAVAQDLVRARVWAAPAAPRPVVEFLVQEWIKYLVVVHARDGTESETWKGAIETMEQLLWSVEPKPTQDERRKLAGAIPALLRALKAGVAAAGTPEATATAFYGELMRCHTEVMRPTSSHAPKRMPAVAAAGTEASIAANAAAATAKTGGEDLLDFAKPVTLNNPFGEGQVEVDAADLDFTPQVAAAIEYATAQPAAPGAPKAEGDPRAGASASASASAKTVRLPSAMVVGAWVEILQPDEGDEMRPARLYYVSPKGSHFLFVDRKGAKVYECSRSMLARRLKLGEVVMLEGEPDASLFDRIMEGLLGKLRAVAPA